MIQAPPWQILAVWLPWIRIFAWLLGHAIGSKPVRLTSWWRSPSHNLSVGGAPDSQHLIGTAVDLVPEDGDAYSLAQQLQRVGLVAIAYPDGHVHAQLFRAGERPRL